MCNFIVVSFINFNFSCYLFNFVNSDVCFCMFCCEDFDSIVVFNFDVSVRFFSNLMDYCIVFIDNVMNFVLVNFYCVNVWSKFI